jgi:alkylhydroperoxidase/carboxymuconolactone decarboxylase family protein YurZ
MMTAATPNGSLCTSPLKEMNLSDQSDLPAALADRADQLLQRKVYEDLAGMIVRSFEAAPLDQKTLMLIWLAALVAIDAPAESFLMNLGAASQTDVTLEQVHGVLEALAPIVGTPRVVSADVKITALLEAMESRRE